MCGLNVLALISQAYRVCQNNESTQNIFTYKSNNLIIVYFYKNYLNLCSFGYCFPLNHQIATLNVSL